MDDPRVHNVYTTFDTEKHGRHIGTGREDLRIDSARLMLFDQLDHVAAIFSDRDFPFSIGICHKKGSK